MSISCLRLFQIYFIQNDNNLCITAFFILIVSLCLPKSIVALQKMITLPQCFTQTLEYMQEITCRRQASARILWNEYIIALADWLLSLIRNWYQCRSNYRTHANMQFKLFMVGTLQLVFFEFLNLKEFIHQRMKGSMSRR